MQTATPRNAAPAADVDSRGLARELARSLEGEVRFGAQSRALYATDASNYRQVPIGVVVPKTIDDVVATHAACRKFGAPLLPRGCGTSLSGETVNVAVVVDFSKYLHRVLEIDAERRLARAEPGAINDKLNDVAKEHGLRFGPDPSTHAYCTIGGNVANNSCGVHSVLAAFEGDGARTSDNVHELDVLTYDGLRLRVGPTSEEELGRIIAEGGRRGEIYARLRDLRDRYAGLIRDRFPDIPRRVSGYNLDELLPEKGFDVARALCGTEGTCVTILEATLKLVPNPKANALVILGYEDVYRAGDHVPRVMAHRPMGCEGMDDLLIREERGARLHVEDLELLPDGKGWLLVQMGGDSREEAEEKARRLMEELRRAEQPPVDMKLYDDPGVEKRLWEVREAGLAATAFPDDAERDAWPGWEDSAVPPDRVGPYLRDLRKLFDAYGYTAALYGHFGQGCIHCRIDFDLRSAEGVRKYRAFVEQAADLVVSYGGSLSGEHGDGQARAELLPRLYGEELVDAFREFKSIWDPEWKMNPGKVVDPRRLDENLKLGADYDPWRPKVEFAYRQDRGDFAHATVRCVGVGKCRTPDGAGVMCPSYIVTREETHTTRGRARLLFEMLQGDVVKDGWRSEEVLDALDLCLACKGCTADCPVNVDMPTYKAEFLHHYYARRLRPRPAYAFGLIDQVARVVSRGPGAVNFLTHTEPFARALKAAAGMAPEREFPAFAPRTLRDWFFSRPTGNGGGRRVLLWPDTFNNYFHTHVGVAAVAELEAAGFHVVMPRDHLCCGRPLYDYGMLDLARVYLRRVLSALRADIRAGTPVIGLEPSCVATFRHELPEMLPDDGDAARLAHQTYHLGEFLLAQDIDPPRLERKAVVWRHCHHHATGGVEQEHELLRKMGLDVTAPEGGCCGLAGSFGFEAAHYGISIACGEHALLPSVRAAPKDALVIADGFSCSTQIEQGGTGRRALHLAEVLRLAREHSPAGPPGDYPERYRPSRPPSPRSSVRRAAALAALAGTALAAATATRR